MINASYVDLSTDWQNRLKAHGPAELGQTDPRNWPAEIYLTYLCAIAGVPSFTIGADQVDAEAYHRLRPLCRRERFLPLFAEGLVLVVACTEPWNRTCLTELRRLLEKEIRVVGITPDNFAQTFATLEGRRDRLKPSVATEVKATAATLLFAWDLDLLDTRNGF
ncbi:MAG TPA: hypothetical protein VKC60_14115, partial [Opitutaceae bacterium]|nr:hypothetical protein [Opitutaceae bacterium]